MAVLHAEVSDLTQFERAGGSRRDNGDLHASPPAAVGQRLSEIPGARAHHARCPARTSDRGDRFCPAALEAADGIERLDLQRDRASQRPAKRHARQGWRVEKRWVDQVHRSADLIKPEPDTLEAGHAQEHE